MHLLSLILTTALGLLVSFIYKHTTLSDFPQLEGGLLFLFCYACYATAEAVQLSGIMALFFNGIVLSHYNSYNLSNTAQVSTEQFFSTFAAITETIVFLYMGMEVFTRSFKNWDFGFAVLGLIFCLIARGLNIFPISFIANCCRQKGVNKIPFKMQCVLWFAGLRGAIAFALSMNLPGPHSDTYAAVTLFICIFTTTVCGSATEKILTRFGMRRGIEVETAADEYDYSLGIEDIVTVDLSLARQVSESIHDRYKDFWRNLDENYMQELFGGASQSHGPSNYHRSGQYELSEQDGNDDDF